MCVELWSGRQWYKAVNFKRSEVLWYTELTYPRLTEKFLTAYCVTLFKYYVKSHKGCRGL